MMSKEIKAPDPMPMFTRTGTPGEFLAFNREIASVAVDLLSKLKLGDLREIDFRFLVYALVVNQTRNGKALTESHLILLHHLMGNRKPPSGALKYMGLPPVDDLERFYKAADLKAANPKLKDAELVDKANISLDTLKGWKTKPFWKQRINFVRSIPKK